MKRRLFGKYLILVMVLIGLMAPNALAGLIKVKCDKGTKVYINVHYADTTFEYAKDDVNNDGEVEFGIVNQDLVQRVYVNKISDGQMVEYSIKINVGGTTMVSLEPFDLPGFAPTDTTKTLIADINIAAFLAQGNPFVWNQILYILNGAAPQTTTITFKDASAYPDSVIVQALADTNFIMNLPNFTGEVQVLVTDQFLPPSEPIPTLTEWGLIILGIILLAVGVVFIIRKKRLMNA